MTSLLANRITTLVRAPPPPMAAAAFAAGRPLRIPLPLPLSRLELEEEEEERQRSRRTCSASSSSSSSPSSSPTPTPMVVIVGATGTGKTKLSIDAALALGGEVVNADKIQLYAGLDITTNKVPLADRRGVPHHLLGAVRPDAGELPPSCFRSLAAAAAASIAARRRVPVVAGGSNSLIHALLARRYYYSDNNNNNDPFAADNTNGRYRPALRFPCCLLWVDVEGALLAEYLDRRVDDMVGGGMVEELREYFAATTPAERASHAAGLGKAIGVAELGGHFAGPGPRRRSLRAAVRDIKANTRSLAEAQVAKIRRMAHAWGWPVQRLDASAAVRARLFHGDEEACWDRDVRGPGLAAIRSFLADRTLNGDDDDDDQAATTTKGQEEPRRMQCGDVVG